MTVLQCGPSTHAALSSILCTMKEKKNVQFCFCSVAQASLKLLTPASAIPNAVM